MSISQIFSHEFYHNSIQTWFWAVVTFFLVLLFLQLAKSLLTRRLLSLAARTATIWDDRLANLARNTKFYFILALALYAGAHVLSLPVKVDQGVRAVTIIAVFFQIGIWGGFIVSYLIEHNVKLEGQAGVGSTTALNFLGKLVLWSFVLIVALGNLGVDITALVTGLGVGGIAIALAAQHILGDLFASLSIMFDKPFVIGDFIIVGDYLGSVERIGLKTTRLRSLSGEQLVFSNADLLQSRIRNYKRMFERRIVFTVGVTYSTPYEKLSKIPQTIRSIVESQQNTRFDRSHFKEYGDSALIFETVYYVKNPDYNIYMDIQQAINLALFKCFEEENIEFAFPTRTLFISSGQPAVGVETTPVQGSES